MQYRRILSRPACLGIDGMQVETVRAGQQAVYQVQVAAQLLSGAGFAGIIPGGSQPTAELAARVFKTANIITLPAVQADRDTREGQESLIGVNPQDRIALPGERVGLLNLRFGCLCHLPARSIQVEDFFQFNHAFIRPQPAEGFEEWIHAGLPNRIDLFLRHPVLGCLKAFGCLEIAYQKPIFAHKKRIVMPAGSPERSEHFRPDGPMASFILFDPIRPYF